MTWTVLLYGVIPLVAFVLVDLYAGIRWGVVAAVVGAAADIAITRMEAGVWDPGGFVALALVAALGWVSIKVDNSLFFKLQPAVMSVFFAGILTYFQIFGPTLSERYLPLIRAAVADDLRAQMDKPIYIAFMNETFTWLIGFFLIYAAVMAVVAWRCQSVTWLVWRGVGFWVLLLAFVVVRLAAFELGSG